MKIQLWMTIMSKDAKIEDAQLKFSTDLHERFVILMDKLAEAGDETPANSAIDAVSIAVAGLIYAFANKSDNPTEMVALMMRDIMTTTMSELMKNLGGDLKIHVFQVSNEDEAPEQNAPSTNTLQ